MTLENFEGRACQRGVTSVWVGERVLAPALTLGQNCARLVLAPTANAKPPEEARIDIQGVSEDGSGLRLARLLRLPQPRALLGLS